MSSGVSSTWSSRGDVRRSVIPTDQIRSSSSDHTINHPIIATISPAHVTTLPHSHNIARAHALVRTPYIGPYYDLRHAHPALNGLAYHPYHHPYQYLHQLHTHVTQPDVTNIRHFIRPYWAQPTTIVANPWDTIVDKDKVEGGPGPPVEVDTDLDNQSSSLAPSDIPEQEKQPTQITALGYTTVSFDINFHVLIYINYNIISVSHDTIKESNLNVFQSKHCCC